VTGEYHVPVMVPQVMELYARVSANPRKVLDCTLGAGGHALEMLKSGGVEKYIGIDADPEARRRAEARLAAYSQVLELRPGFFDEVLQGLGGSFDFILFDLGLSMHQFEDSARGFSFLREEALDMRMSPEQETSAFDIVNSTREEDLANLIYAYGEERYSRHIAKAICKARARGQVRTSAALAQIIADAVPPSYRHGRIHPATRTFQAIRISVNDELGREERGLALAADLLAPGGILAVISFHSLEDRIAKRFCKDLAKSKGLSELYKKPLVPDEAECEANPASRSAKLRAVQRPSAGEKA